MNDTNSIARLQPGESNPDAIDLLAFTSSIVTAYVHQNALSIDDVPRLIREVYSALSTVGTDPTTQTEELPEPAVSIRASIKPDHIVCLEDGKKLKMLKRHLMTHYGMTPDDYRKRWSLPADYPMVAPNYAEKRRELAVKIGLGRKPNANRGRKPKAGA